MSLRELLASRSTTLADLRGDILLVHSDLSGTRQLYAMPAAGGEPRQLTDFPEPVGEARLAGVGAVIEVDHGGDERHQLYLLPLDRPAPVTSTAELEAVTSDPRYVHRLAGIDEDCGLVAYLSNARNGVDFDLWLVRRSTGERRLLHAPGGYCVPASGFSPGGRFVSILRLGTRPLDTDLLLVEVATGEARLVLAHPDEAALVGAPAWVDATQCFVSSNVGRDFAAVVRYD
ncbi:MAG TPA: hypothetical protein VMD59_07635, partial [Acidimicrobiales bacterium]|nr:hypothetical protein [Acidimicrobiales bacterium]